MEVSSLDVFLTIQGADSVVEGLRVARFSNSADDYGVVKLLGAADRTVVRDVETTDAAFQAFMLAGEESTSGILEGVVLENLTISRANWMGISSNMVGNLTMRRLWIAHLNQFKEFTNAPQSGAFKASRNRNVKFVDGVVENNNGHGVWFDQSSYTRRSPGTGSPELGGCVFFEISDGLVLANNYINSGTGERAVKLAGASAAGPGQQHDPRRERPGGGVRGQQVQAGVCRSQQGAVLGEHGHGSGQGPPVPGPVGLDAADRPDDQQHHRLPEGQRVLRRPGDGVHHRRQRDRHSTPEHGDPQGRLGSGDPADRDRRQRVCQWE